MLPAPTTAVTRVTAMPPLPQRQQDAHKGSCGRVLVVAGSVGMSGAAILTGLGALRGGAGLVDLAVPEPIQETVARGHPCYLTHALPTQLSKGTISPSAVKVALELGETADALVVGPGLRRGRSVALLLTAVLTRLDKPVVIDADGLRVLTEVLAVQPRLERRIAPILTPHPGEFAHLIGKEVAEVQAHREMLAARFAAEHAVVLALKGHGTIVTDGTHLFKNNTGNPGMASGGTGDVLAGLIGALLAQGMPPFAAAQLGVHVHGLAGDLARDRLGEHALLATDLVDHLGPAFLRLGERG